MGGLPNELIPIPRTPNRGVVNRQPHIEHIMQGRRTVWSPLWWWPCQFTSFLLAVMLIFANHYCKLTVLFLKLYQTCIWVGLSIRPYLLGLTLGHSLWRQTCRVSQNIKRRNISANISQTAIKLFTQILQACCLAKFTRNITNSFISVERWKI